MNLVEPLSVAFYIIDIFTLLDIPYFIGGSFASSLYGIPRTTQDIDIVADIDLRQTTPLIKLLKDRFYIEQETILDAVKRKSSFNIIHLETMFKVDVFLMKDTLFSKQEMTRRRLELIISEVEHKVYFVSPEDIILEKLLWYKLGGEVSERQLRDISGILKIQANRLDIFYMEYWAKCLEIENLLKKVIGYLVV